jgi:hypothetical protein
MEVVLLVDIVDSITVGAFPVLTSTVLVLRLVLYVCRRVCGSYYVATKLCISNTLLVL